MGLCLGTYNIAVKKKKKKEQSRLALLESTCPRWAFRVVVAVSGVPARRWFRLCFRGVSHPGVGVSHPAGSGPASSWRSEPVVGVRASSLALPPSGGGVVVVIAGLPTPPLGWHRRRQCSHPAVGWSLSSRGCQPFRWAGVRHHWRSHPAVGWLSSSRGSQPIVRLASWSLVGCHHCRTPVVVNGRRRRKTGENETGLSSCLAS